MSIRQNSSFVGFCNQINVPTPRSVLEHPLQQQNEVEYLKKAAEWFAAAETWSYAEESEGEAYEALCALADTYFRLQSWKDALGAYTRLKRFRLELQPTKAGDEFDTKIDSILAECKRR